MSRQCRVVCDRCNSNPLRLELALAIPSTSNTGLCTGPATFAHRRFVRNTFAFPELSWISNFKISRVYDGQIPEAFVTQELVYSRQVGHVARHLDGAVRHGLHARLGCRQRKREGSLEGSRRTA